MAKLPHIQGADATLPHSTLRSINDSFRKQLHGGANCD